MTDIVLSSADVFSDVNIFSSTKDSISVQWNTRDQMSAAVSVQGFKVQYQAFGSAVKQQSDMLQPTAHVYDITQLHENTHYNVCVRVITNVTSLGHASTCVTGTTAINSLSVALGSTLGAFLALGVIVMFVLIAKWQHYRRRRKLLHTKLGRDSLVSIPINAMTGERISMMGNNNNGIRNGYIELSTLRTSTDTQEV